MADGFDVRNGLLHADDLPLDDLAARYGTPLYVYSAGRIRANIKRFQDALKDALPSRDDHLVAFACKANSNIGVLSLVRAYGMGCDIVSGGEMTRALQSGIPPGDIVYSGVGKSRAEIRQALETGIRQINVESPRELYNIEEIAAETRKNAVISFRFNPDVDAGTHDKISTGRHDDKFGINAADIDRLYAHATDSPHLTPVGLSVHIGSQLINIDPFADAFARLADKVRDLRDRGFNVDRLDLGGGLGIVYGAGQEADLAGYAALIKKHITPLGTAIILEPGRYITGDAGILLCTVSYIKETPARRYVVLDAGMNDLMRPALYDATHPLVPVVQKDTAGSAENDGYYDVVGPVCETGDVFEKQRPFSPPPAPGALYALSCAGAYGFVMASNYNTRPLPAEIMVDGAQCALIRRRQTVEDILAYESVPDWISS